MGTSLKYIGWVILDTDNNWPAVVRTLDQVKMVCRRMLHILSREEATPRLSGLNFKAVIQAVIIFGTETWVITPVSEPGGEIDNRTSHTEHNAQDVEIHLGSGGNCGGGFLDNRRIRQAAPEHGRTVYHYVITVRRM